LCFEEAFNNAFKTFGKPVLRGSVEGILNDPKIIDETEISTFWLLSAALTKFYNDNKCLPVAGTIPDMTSTTDFFLDLQKM
jgi:NEDD8-activating enzyme E1 regulatory subunit